MGGRGGWGLLFLAPMVGKAEKVSPGRKLASWQEFSKVFRGWEPHCKQESLGHL